MSEPSGLILCVCCAEVHFPSEVRFIASGETVSPTVHICEPCVRKAAAILDGKVLPFRHPVLDDDPVSRPYKPGGER